MSMNDVPFVDPSAASVQKPLTKAVWTNKQLSGLVISLVPVNLDRKAMIISNRATVGATITFPSSTNIDANYSSVTVPARGFLPINFPYTGALNAKLDSATTTGYISICEFSE